MKILFLKVFIFFAVISIAYSEEGLVIKTQNGAEIDISLCTQYNTEFILASDINVDELRDQTGDLLALEFSNGELDANGTELVYLLRFYQPNQSYDADYALNVNEADYLVEEYLTFNSLVKVLRLVANGPVVAVEYMTTTTNATRWYIRPYISQ
jgi:hypothetical protein